MPKVSNPFRSKSSLWAVLIICRYIHSNNHICSISPNLLMQSITKSLNQILWSRDFVYMQNARDVDPDPSKNKTFLCLGSAYFTTYWTHSQSYNIYANTTNKINYCGQLIQNEILGIYVLEYMCQYRIFHYVWASQYIIFHYVLAEIGWQNHE